MIYQLKQIDPNIKENYPLKELTTFKIGGPAKFFSVVDNEKLLIKLLKFAKTNHFKFLIIGKGSNLLISDQGSNGLVIKLDFKEIVFKNSNVEVSADYPLNQLVALTVSKNLTGLEFATGIPGTIGGAAVGNAGAYDGQIGDIVKKVEVLDNNFQKQTLTNKALQFSYRNSILKRNNYILLKVYLKLKKGDKLKSVQRMNKIALTRWQNHPHQPSAGSIFKNVSLSDDLIKKIQSENYQIPEKFFEYKKIPAAWLIERVGLKGKKIGGAQISEKHANHLVNLGNAKADEVVQLISLVKMKVRDEFGIQLEEEVRYVGF